jgi:putative transposase
MGNTYTQLYIHNVFAVDFRQSLIKETWEEELYKYITGTVQGLKQKMIAINGVPDHIHFLIGIKPTCCISDLMREIKKCSTEFIKEKVFTKSKFKWQEGFGSFSVSKNDLDRVIAYIMNQKEHHKKVRFKNEYLKLLKDYEVDFNEMYLFEWVEKDVSILR